MIYTQRNNNCWIRVVAYTNHYRAATNNQDAYAQIDKVLSFRRNKADAQADLDELAAKLGWNEVTNRR